MNKCGKIFIVGIGPGNLDEMTPKARLMIDSADVIVGYKTYVKLIEKIIGDKKVSASGMRQEIQFACTEIFHNAPLCRKSYEQLPTIA